MDASAPLTAYTVVNTWSYEELRRILFEYGEERYAPAIARAICRTRETHEIETTLQLVDVIKGGNAPTGPCGRNSTRPTHLPGYPDCCQW